MANVISKLGKKASWHVFSLKGWMWQRSGVLHGLALMMLTQIARDWGLIQPKALLAFIALSAAQSSAQTRIHSATFVIDTASNASYNQVHWLVRTPYLSIKASNVLSTLIIQSCTFKRKKNKNLHFSRSLLMRFWWLDPQDMRCWEFGLPLRTLLASHLKYQPYSHSWIPLPFWKLINLLGRSRFLSGSLLELNESNRFQPSTQTLFIYFRIYILFMETTTVRGTKKSIYQLPRRFFH